MGAPLTDIDRCMTRNNDFEIFLVAPPGLEAALAAEARVLRFKGAKAVPGGVTIKGGWPEVWRANLELRGAGRVIAGIASFRAEHLTDLEKRARKVAWRKVLRADVPFRVEASCKHSRIYHSGAAAQRIEDAIKDELGAPLSPDAIVCVRVHIADNLCSIGVDTSGELLHKRGHKEAVNKAPMRETMASLFLRQCKYNGREPVVDPMCGSGTFIIEAAEIAAGLKPGRSRIFAFEKLATFDRAAWKLMRETGSTVKPERALLRQRPRRRRDSDEQSQRRACGCFRADGIQPARGERPGGARGSARPRHHQPALRHPHRREDGTRAALSRARTDTAHALLRLARGPDRERSLARPRDSGFHSCRRPPRCRMEDFG